MVETIVFIIAGGLAIMGALGVVLSRNPVHAALSLVGTLFSVAVLFVAQEAHLLAAVQVIVYAGAIVILFLFVIMLLGVDEAEDLEVEPIAGQRPIALGLGLGTVILAIVAIAVSTDGATGLQAATGAIEEEAIKANINQIAELLFTDYVLAFELTALLLTVAVVGAIVLARRPDGDYLPAPESALDASRHVDDVEEVEEAGDAAEEVEVAEEEAQS